MNMEGRDIAKLLLDLKVILSEVEIILSELKTLTKNIEQEYWKELKNGK